ncbi:hypothetical protein [Streptomonospora litoralis]|uniref:Uncharacterized protein n=1 Tax=Streptomonospora litoralis TaxID=2498135 RepID=A0A4P6PZ41_9ACTN|nr:hypothetical protein [Streptomonospora litoralis]QBI53455.1 hypothetical protein EKD16_08305 [Streptomonospora litoralis]
MTHTPSSAGHPHPRLRDMLAALVPLRMHELAAVDWHQLQLHLDALPCRGCKEDTCRGAATILGAHGDALLYTPGTPASAAARRALVDGLAIAGLTAEGGVYSWLDLHFCGRIHEECPNPGGRPTVPRLVDDPPPNQRPEPRHTETVELNGSGRAAL